jgi:hypothetical protein
VPALAAEGAALDQELLFPQAVQPCRKDRIFIAALAAEGRQFSNCTTTRIGDWKTRAVFDRYNIVDEKDLADAAAKLDQKAQPRKRHSASRDRCE